MITNNIDTQR